MIKKMTADEYLFMNGQLNGIDPDYYNEVKDSCHDQGWLDAFGLVTRRGQQAIDRFAKDTF